LTGEKQICLGGSWDGSSSRHSGDLIYDDNIGSVMPVSNLEATPATRLFELWVEQHMFDNVLAVKVGQLAADQEFILSNSYSYFLNGTFGWPEIAATDLPSGGPAYPLATPGVRVAIRPNEQFKLMIGVYNGDPANPNCANENPQVSNSDGLDFSLDSPALLMIEGRYKYNLTAQLPGTVKVGGWNHFGTFPDERLDSDDLPIAITLNRGRPIDGDWAIYGIITSSSGAYQAARKLKASACSDVSWAHRLPKTSSTSMPKPELPSPA
jgi:porin